MIGLNVLSQCLLNKLFLLFLLSFLVTFLLVPVFIKIALFFNILDSPDDKLKKHKQKTPYLGGLAIYFGFIVSIILANNTIPNENQLSINFFAGITLLVVLGFIDDILILKPLVKLIGQFCASLLLVVSMENASFIWILFIIWFMSMMNAFNFIDVMDGLATIIAFACTVSWLIYAILFGQVNASIILVCFLGPLLAFFYYNKPNAKIFMGDSGSLFIGGLLSIVPFFFKNLFVLKNSFIFVPIFIYAIPFFELSSLILIRLYKKIPIYLGSPDHFSIYLLRKGWTKANVLFFGMSFSLISFFITLLFVFNYINLFLFFSLGAIYLVYLCIVVFKRN